MVTTYVGLIDIKPMVNAPSWALMNELAEQLVSNRRKCRDSWWKAHATVCLDNKKVERAGSGRVKLGSAVGPVGVIVPKTDRYQARKVSVQVRWGDGSITNEAVTG